MITVTISINGSPIYTRSAINKITINEGGKTMYKVDTGKTIWHKRDDGAVKLAIQMLKTIKEVK